MKYQIGDEILVLQTNEEGRVQEILNEKMVIVEVRGVRFPIQTDQIDFPYFNRFFQKKVIPEKKIDKTYIDQIPIEKKVQTNQIKASVGAWLTFIPKYSFDEFGDDMVDYFKVYLVNHTDDMLRFYYRQDANGQLQFELKAEISQQKEVYIQDLDFSVLNDSPLFSVEFSLAKPDKKHAEFYETELKLRPKQVFKKVEELKDKSEPTLSYQLFETYPEKVIEDNKIDLSSLSKAGYKVYDASKIKEHLPPVRSVVDLHIEKISNNWKGLNNFEIIQMQLKEFEKWYQIAVANMQPNLIVIHGVGKGVLREEIHHILKAKKEVKTFVNQYDVRFGYGATEIFFQY
ncbi:Smr/MutS family protein [Arachidicoccus sp.]|uniref:Smr/MutS family protein n=1 Tax=Arachidicoccus sp. TaxID=1872624 RepID=UPI003D24CC05